MPTFEYVPPGQFRRSIYGCSQPSDNFRLKSLLLLSGLGTVSKAGVAKPSKLDIDYISLPAQRVNPSSTAKISRITAKFPGHTRKDLDYFFQAAIFRNISIHKNVYHELANILGHQHDGNHIAAFLHIYRVIEQIALCLPIVSIVKKGSFDNTFTDFKGLVQGGAKTDLAVLRKYSENHLDRAIADSSANISFFRTTKPKQNVNVIKRFFSGKDSAGIISETIDSIEIKYRDIDKLVIGFRNQFFHYLFHEKNLSITDMEFPDEFLGACNPIFINYLGFLYHEFLMSELAMWGR